ncbi:LysM peptidoglycan-binding domain-containing protein [Okeanomitos corallinicola TIOX110]|uniref:LysM peptidoglycan-binding domain-containing protein n=1 Tax=Okeanomitos corallinicola TIOX110 TaxID=3133117 RepID=A0ABZ2UNM2_9CYAN
MNIKIDCPVCGYKEIEGKTCPNCDTDLTLIRSLQELPPIETTISQRKLSTWTLVLALLILIIGIGLGALSSFFLIKNQYSDNVFTNNSAVVINQESVADNKNININLYTVKRGDNLGIIAEKVCGKASAWRLIAEANPRLENRRNYFIQVGEKLKIPNCQEKIQ